VDEYVKAYYRFHPIRGPESGFHEQDGTGLDDVSPEAIANEAAMVRDFQKRVAAIPKERLTAMLTVDREVFDMHLAGRLYELETAKVFTRDPYYYADIIQMGILYQMLFEYPGTTLDSRLQIVLKQLDTVPTLIQNAIRNIETAPEELINYGLTSLNDTIWFLENDVPLAFVQAKLPDGSLAEETLKARIAVATEAINGLIAHLEELKASTAPKPSFALGEAGLAERLRLKHGLTLPEQKPFEKILQRLTVEIEENKKAFEDVTKAIDPTRPPLEVWNEVRTHHAKPGEVADSVKGQVDEIVAFLKEKDLIAIPTDETVIVKTAPAFMLYWYATCWSTGPFEEELAPPAVYYISDPAGLIEGEEGQTDEEAQNAFLTDLNTPELYSCSAHEAYPGHFIHGYALKSARKKYYDAGKISQVAINNIFMPYSLSEGWAVYSEELLREQGFLKDGDPRAYQEYLMAQRSDALLRLSRAYAGIKMHLGEMSVDEAVEFIAENSFISSDYAATEAERGTYEPDYILYAIGRMAITQMRDDYKAALERQGETFTLRRFHDALFEYGQYPLPIIRRLLILGDSGELFP